MLLHAKERWDRQRAGGCSSDRIRTERSAGSRSAAATCIAIWVARITKGFQALEIWLRLSHGGATNQAAPITTKVTRACLKKIGARCRPPELPSDLLHKRVIGAHSESLSGGSLDANRFHSRPAQERTRCLRPQQTRSALEDANHSTSPRWISGVTKFPDTETVRQRRVAKSRLLRSAQSNEHEEQPA
jgi:hypothetical protein